MHQGIHTVEHRSGAASLRADVAISPRGHIITSVAIACPTGVTQRMLRQVPLGKLIAEARGHSDVRLPDAGQLPTTSGRTLLTDALLRQVALVYIEEAASSSSGRVLERVARRFERPEETVRHWIGRARQAGWLAPGMQGRLDVAPGPRLEADPHGEALQPSDQASAKVEAAAELFRAAVASGVRGPGRYVARQLGVSDAAVSRRLKVARRAGLLAAPSGRNGDG